MESVVAVSDDPGLETVVAWLVARTRDPRGFFAQVVRKSIDEVLDGPRTGRWSFDQLEKTEKTYVGTKLEIVARTELGLQPAGFMDLDIEGYPVDVKWSMTSVWQIPREAVGQLCLCIGGIADMTQFQVGVVRCSAGHLNEKSNQDGKKTLSRAGRQAMRIIVPPSPMLPNFIADMDPSIRDIVMSQPTIQKRVTKLFQLLPYVPIPRNALRTVARTEGDPMRRIRKDTHAGDPLEGFDVLSSKYDKQLIEALGYPTLRKDEFMAVPKAEVDELISKGFVPEPE